MRNPTIWVYEKGKQIRSSTPTSEAHERDYYAIEGGEQLDYRFEFFLQKTEDLYNAPQKLDR
jgi:hypothetical protein